MTAVNMCVAIALRLSTRCVVLIVDDDPCYIQDLALNTDCSDVVLYATSHATRSLPGCNKI